MYVVYVFQFANALVSCRCRWAQFRQSFDEIESKVKALVNNNEQVNYRQHIGGGHFVSVTTGFACVDLRKFFVPYGQTEVKAMRKVSLSVCRNGAPCKNWWRRCTTTIQLWARRYHANFKRTMRIRSEYCNAGSAIRL